MAMQADLLISGLTVHSAQGVWPGASVSIQNGVIGEIFRGEAPRSSGRRLEFPASYHLAPGRIDMHIHGAQGADVMDATPAALDQIRQSLAAEGVTGFLATTVTESMEKINLALQNIDNYQKNISKAVAGAEILGIHLEGPFISPRRPGAHRVELLLAPDLNLFDRWQAYAGGWIKLVTIAPELPGGIEFIHHLHRLGLIAAIGHSDADFKTTGSAVAAGARHATHLFNAMRGFHHREPGCVGAILQNPLVVAELIADGYHCHPAALDMAFHLKGKEGLVLVTDAMRAKCCGSTGPFDLGGQTVMVQEGAARLKNGVLAGSVLTMTQAVKNMLRFTTATLEDLIYLTSINPAKALGIGEKKGTIFPGKDADLAVLDDHLEVVLTVSKGRIIYQQEGHIC